MLTGSGMCERVPGTNVRDRYFWKKNAEWRHFHAHSNSVEQAINFPIQLEMVGKVLCLRASRSEDLLVIIPGSAIYLTVSLMETWFSKKEKSISSRSLF